MPYSSLKLEIVGPVATATLDRPQVHNAFDETLVAELTEAFRLAGQDAAVRVVVLAGAGASFCAGADLEWMGRVAGYSAEDNVADARALQRMLASVAECPKVTIARVQGAAMGGGAGLAAACDIAVAAEDATFAFSEVRLGLIPSVIAPYVVQKIGTGSARALFVTGERFTAQTAQLLGLVQQVAPSSELDAAVAQTLQHALRAGPHAVTAIKLLLRDIAGRTPPEAAELTAARIAEVRVGAEGQEGMYAFLEKRKPGWVS